MTSRKQPEPKSLSPSPQAQSIKGPPATQWVALRRVPSAAVSVPSTSTTSNDKAAPGETQQVVLGRQHDVLLFDRGRCSPCATV
jgi:hypothetical protein